MIDTILNKEEFSKEDIVYLLSLTNDDDKKKLFRKSYSVKEQNVGKKVYYRGLIELSNKCKKDCYYCGIRASNSNVERYELAEEDVLEAAVYAWKNNYSSLVIQSGERSDKAFVDTLELLLDKIGKLTNNELGITLSCGEQTEETYKRWKDKGARRYLLRIEASNEEMYYRIHPNDETHSYSKRIEALKTLQKLGYQTGTGVMIGLPLQTIEDLADDILFFKNMDIDMIGMGPYIEHEDTPLYNYNNMLLLKVERFNLSLRMIAVLRLVMNDINIASSTAMQAIDPMGREKAIQAGANIIMPNLTDSKYKKNYQLYEGKPCLDDDVETCKNCLDTRITLLGEEVAYGEHGDSIHFKKRFKK